jgi:hypothetical protein
MAINVLARAGTADERKKIQGCNIWQTLARVGCVSN